MERLHQGNPREYNAEGITLTPEEMAVLQECYKDAFMNRGLPCTLVGAGGVYYGIKYGFIKPYANLGIVGTMGVVGLIGYVGGLISYKIKCAQKLLTLPNGTLKQRIEEMQRRQPNLTSIPPRSTDLPEAHQARTRSHMNSNLDMDMYQPPHDFDGFTGVNADGDGSSDYTLLEPLDKYAGTPTTYDELRRKNREEYAKSQSAGRVPFPTDNTQFGAPQTPISEGSYFTDRDRVPQYQLD